jgi:hypothetical protein
MPRHGLIFWRNALAGVTGMREAISPTGGDIIDSGIGAGALKGGNGLSGFGGYGSGRMLC